MATFANLAKIHVSGLGLRPRMNAGPVCEDSAAKGGMRKFKHSNIDSIINVDFISYFTPSITSVLFFLFNLCKCSKRACYQVYM